MALPGLLEVPDHDSARPASAGGTPERRPSRTVESLSCGAIPPPSGGRRLARIYEMRID